MKKESSIINPLTPVDGFPGTYENDECTDLIIKRVKEQKNSTNCCVSSVLYCFLAQVRYTDFDSSLNINL